MQAMLQPPRATVMSSWWLETHDMLEVAQTMHRVLC